MLAIAQRYPRGSGINVRTEGCGGRHCRRYRRVDTEFAHRFRLACQCQRSFYLGHSQGRWVRHMFCSNFFDRDKCIAQFFTNHALAPSVEVIDPLCTNKRA